MEKAIEIKRRAQRCILNGDLDGALNEYEKLIASGDSDPYHSVLLADLLYKKGDQGGAARRYLEAVDGYERVGLVKNAIAVCKKMSRLSLSPAAVLERLAKLHALDGLITESSLYYMQHAELLMGESKSSEAEQSLRKAFQVCPDNVRALERLAEVREQGGDRDAAARTLLEASVQHERLGQLVDAKRCQARAEQLQPGVSANLESKSESRAAAGPAAAKESPAGPGAAAPHRAAPEPVRPPSPVEALEPSPEPVAAAGPESTVAAHRGDTHAATARESPHAVVARADTSPARPSLAFETSRAPSSSAAATAEEPGAKGLPDVSVLLNQAQTLFQSGERDAASATLVRAAQAYDHLGHFDNAAAIYRSLSQAYEAPLQVMLLWLKNCQRRDDRREAARVACELGDRALVDSDEAGAREWFERARAFDAENELADRRLQLMNAETHENRTATVPGPTATPSSPETRTAAVVSSPARAPNRTGAEATSPAPRPGFVEISLQHEEPVGFDLGEMIAEFQRGLEEQLDSDPQGHYDLGMSYREMGLFEHAVLSFRTAARSSAFRVRASEMIGRCMLDQGDFDSAAAQLLETLGLPELSPGAAIDIHYQLGLALEAGGRLDEALGQFEQIYAAEANYPGVASKIRTLRKTLEKD